MENNEVSKLGRKSKLITSACMLLIIIVLYMTCYLLFFRMMDVDVTENLLLSYNGENGSATVKVANNKANYNQRVQEFMDSVQYSVTPDSHLSNGDIIQVTTTYNEELATRYHISPIHVTSDIEVNNLPERLQDKSLFTQEFFDSLTVKSDAYLKVNKEQILNEDFTAFYVDTAPEFVSNQSLYRVFLSAKEESQKDKIIDIYAITAKGKVNVSSENEVLEEKENTIFYMITYNEINSSFTVKEENIYGEKIIVSQDTDLHDTALFQTYLTTKYQERYTIEMISDEK